jgi:tetratricopeptide (TPR) repeat protein
MSLCKTIFLRARHCSLTTGCLFIVFSLSLFGCSTQPSSNPISAVETLDPSPVRTIEAEPKQTPSALENTSAVIQNTPSAREVSNYQEAVLALNNQDTHKALIIFEELQTTQPWFIGAWINGGKALVDQGHWEEALKALKQAENIHPELPAVYTLQAYCHRQTGDFHKAQSAYEKALSFQPDYALAHYNYGILLDLYLQKPAQALLHYERYQTLQNKPDKQVQDWIKELKRRVKDVPSKP